MSRIDVVVIGNGWASVSDPDPLDGQTVYLTAIPNDPDILEDIYGFDSGGHSIAFYVQPTQAFTYNAQWGDITIVCQFSGTTPPPTPTVLNWLIPILAKRKNKRLNKR